MKQRNHSSKLSSYKENVNLRNTKHRKMKHVEKEITMNGRATEKKEHKENKHIHLREEH